jgi:hypothetical protein
MVKPSFRGASKTRTRNLENPGSSLSRRPGMTSLGSHCEAHSSAEPLARNDARRPGSRFRFVTYFPTHCGGRFSANALGPSTKSCDAAMAFTAG